MEPDGYAAYSRLIFNELVKSFGIPMTLILSEEQIFRQRLNHSPATALAAFFQATGGVYEGTCVECRGRGTSWKLAYEQWLPCPTCHGTGGSPSPDLCSIAADWYGDGVEADVLRSFVKQ